MANNIRRKQSQMRHRNRIKSKCRMPTRRTPGRHVNRSHGKKHLIGKYSRKTQIPHFDSVRMTNEAQNILHFCVHDLYRKVSMAAERLRKKKRHVSITASDVKNALKRIMPKKYDRKSVPSISCKCH